MTMLYRRVSRSRPGALRSGPVDLVSRTLLPRGRLDDGAPLLIVVFSLSVTVHACGVQT